MRVGVRIRVRIRVRHLREFKDVAPITKGFERSARACGGRGEIHQLRRNSPFQSGCHQARDQRNLHLASTTVIVQWGEGKTTNTTLGNARQGETRQHQRQDKTRQKYPSQRLHFKEAGGHVHFDWCKFYTFLLHCLSVSLSCVTVL